MNDLKEKYNLSDEEILYIGDDINDIECLKSVKYAVTVNQANYAVKQINGIQITEAPAGDGAFREVIDNIMELKRQEESNEA